MSRVLRGVNRWVFRRLDPVVAIVMLKSSGPKMPSFGANTQVQNAAMMEITTTDLPKGPVMNAVKELRKAVTLPKSWACAEALAKASMSAAKTRA